jgi:hypothetical protein
MGNYYMPDGALVRCSLVVCLTPLTTVQCILCDCICAWRTVILWNKDKRIIAILVFAILVTTGT